MSINNDDLGIIYLLNKNKKGLPVLYRSAHEEMYGLGNEIYLMSSTDKDITSFRIINTKLLKRCDEPFGEVFVNPAKAEINFISHYLGHTNQRIRVRHDDIEHNWDVRYNNGKDEVLTDLPKALELLGNNPEFGIEERTSFEGIIETSKEVFKKAKENKK